MVIVNAFYKGGTPAAGIVASTLALDLNHVGAEIGQHLPGPRAGENPGKFKDAEAR
jgi:hypothetical protein